MSHEPDIKELLKKHLGEAGGYRLEACDFIREGLAHTVKLVHGDDAAGVVLDEDDESRHVSGRQLCMGLRDYAIQRWGKMARLVLNRWNIRATDDFGRIVFAMVDAGLMRKTDRDSLLDFEEVFDFDEAFALPPPSALREPARAASPVGGASA